MERVTFKSPHQSTSIIEIMKLLLSYTTPDVLGSNSITFISSVSALPLRAGRWVTGYKDSAGGHNGN